MGRGFFEDGGGTSIFWLRRTMDLVLPTISISGPEKEESLTSIFHLFRQKANLSSPNPDIPRAGRGGAAHSGAQRGRSGGEADGSVRPGDNRPPFALQDSWASQKTFLNDFSETRTKEILCSSAKRPRTWSTAPPTLAADQCTDAYLSL